MLLTIRKRHCSDRCISNAHGSGCCCLRSGASLGFSDCTLLCVHRTEVDHAYLLMMTASMSSSATGCDVTCETRQTRRMAWAELKKAAMEEAELGESRTLFHQLYDSRRATSIPAAALALVASLDNRPENN